MYKPEKRLRGLKVGLFLLACSLSTLVSAFTIEDIRVEGLQRISAGTVFSYLPLKVGDELTRSASANAIRELFKTGFFSDVRLEQEGNVLIVSVIERPSVADITISGNDDIEDDAIIEQLKEVGLATGRVFDESTLDKVEQELKRTYFALGKYNADVQTTVTPMERNRVGVHFDVTEGSVAKIKEINIVGNQAYDDDDLLDLMSLEARGMFSWLSGSGKYSKRKLSGDLENIRSHYLNNGYIKFNIESTQVSLNPERDGVFITINVSEGAQYTVRSMKLAGDLVVEENELFKEFEIQAGDIFSRESVTGTSTAISDRLGDDGYAFANVNAIPDIDDTARQVDITFYVDPGKRVYVRRVSFKGNSKTRDEVLRREMRQLEGGWISTKNVEKSKTRLERLGYFDEVNVETPAVPGSTDQVDVDFNVVERPSGNFLAGVGFSQSQGLVLSTSVNQDNFLGSGKRVGFAFNNSQVNKVFSFSFFNPYYTIDGVSRGFDVFYRETDAANANISDYSTNRLGGNVTFGVPITDEDRINLGVGIENTDVVLGSFPSLQIRRFVLREGDSYRNWNLNASWTRDSRNRAVFPDRGARQRFNAEITMPGSDLTYYKVDYSHQRYFPLGRDFTLLLKGEIGYGNAYGGTTELPFFENYFAGGIRSVRGFEDNSLGGRDSNNDPLGGSLKVVGGAEVIIPVPLIKDTRSVRFSGFLDAGQVYSKNESFSDETVRWSLGGAVSWISPLGALTFSYAQPMNDEPGDNVQEFQFTFGNLF